MDTDCFYCCDWKILSLVNNKTWCCNAPLCYCCAFWWNVSVNSIKSINVLAYFPNYPLNRLQKNNVAAVSILKIFRHTWRIPRMRILHCIRNFLLVFQICGFVFSSNVLFFRCLNLLLSFYACCHLRKCFPGKWRTHKFRSSNLKRNKTFYYVYFHT